MSDDERVLPELSGKKKYEQKQLLPFCFPTSHISHVLLVTCQTKINQQVRFFTFDKFFLHLKEVQTASDFSAKPNPSDLLHLLWTSGCGLVTPRSPNFEMDSYF